MQDISPVLSECPKCKQDRVQHGYRREELIESLRIGAPIRAYCASCDEEWALSTEELADLGRELTRRS